MLYAKIFYLFIDGLDVLIDLALVAEAFCDGLGQQFVSRMVFDVDLA